MPVPIAAERSSQATCRPRCAHDALRHVDDTVAKALEKDVKKDRADAPVLSREIPAPAKTYPAAPAATKSPTPFRTSSARTN